MEEKIDARKLPREVLEEKRRQAHRLRERGMTRAEIGGIVGVHADTVGRWLKVSHKQLQLSRGGRKAGDGRHLNAEQETYIRRLIADKLPEQLKLD
jgi:transposase